MTTPKVSIVIPLFNKEEYILVALNSVLKQSFKNWECLVIDDGSTDNSCKVVEKYINEHPGNWSLITQENEGPSSTRNRGIASSRGEYIAFLDADDFWHPNKLERQIEIMDLDTSIAMTLSRYLIFSEEKGLTMKVVTFQSIKKLLSGWLKMTGFGGLVESTGIIRSSLITPSLFFDTSLPTSEGLDYVLKWSQVGKISFIPKIGTFYRISTNQLHRNEDSVIASMRVLANRNSTGKQLARLTSLHSSYFELSSLRNISLTSKIYKIMHKFLKGDRTFIYIFVSVLVRNIFARILAIGKKAYFRNAIKAIS